LLCCRLWWLKHWEFRELSYPYWRIYHNDRPGASVTHGEKVYHLVPGKVLLIAPNTSYRTRIGEHPVPETGYHLQGGRISDGMPAPLEGSLQHLFIHFTIGVPFDRVTPGIFQFGLNDQQKEEIGGITGSFRQDYARFELHTMITLHSLINGLLARVPRKKWEVPATDQRILHVLNHIESQMGDGLSNPELAGRAGLSTNAFQRLFTGEVGISPQKYVRNKRIEKASTLLHHSELSIEEVAERTGFADRFHFSKSFKAATGLTPVRYRKEFCVKLT
jgi:AraC-like DNA-binding protein